MTSRPLLASLLLASTLLAGSAWGQADPLTDPLPRALGRQNDERLDRVEKTLREMRSILFQGRDTGRAVVVQPAETQSQVQALSQRVADLEATLRTINGQLDSATNDVVTLRRDAASATNSVADRQAAANAALVTRIESLERQLKEQAERAAAAAAAVPVGSGFDNAMKLYIDGQHRASATAFQSYLDANPDSADAPEANYYLGESLYRQADFQGAASAYLRAIRSWPATPWAPDATVKLAQSLVELKTKNADACQILTEFNTRYPRATAALKATAAATRTRARC